MRVFLLTALTMVAFASNSLLNRAALAGPHIDAISFGTIRLIAGAVALGILMVAMRGALRLGGAGRIGGVVGLMLYLYAFSVAYVTLDAGLGALILFGTVQITMFAGSLMGGERPPLLRWLGAALAFSGLAWLLWPGPDAQTSVLHAGAMVVAGIGWGIYSLAGRKASDPLMATAANFILCAPLGVLVGLAMPVQIDPIPMTGWGIALAVVCGAVTSGLGYALWYRVLPDLPGTVAAVAQLTVPIIAMAGGMLFLGEALTVDFAIAAVVVLGGVGLSLIRGQGKAGSTRKP
ncbi:DMT family transporter [Cognatishimia sp. F0-27]|uniref:DMT family transporter n=1 Tax=Cognatishimia sp. F0-27 TaxID=2816855 RepID=UPI001D0CAB1C|nr:DMT family transporter [Cognatishimia sp. F0-27]MCC1490996.1 DMT family transporter [Cognatishimia sp. F0-27]